MPKYWEYEIVNGKCNISFVTVEDLETKLTALKEMEEEWSQKVKQAKKEMDDSKTPEDKTANTEKYLGINDEYSSKKRELSKNTEYWKISERNKGMSLIVERLKDMYSRKESVSVVINYNGTEDGKIISTISKIKEDIYRLEEYGVFLTAPYCFVIASHHFKLNHVLH